MISGARSNYRLYALVNIVQDHQMVMNIEAKLLISPIGYHDNILGHAGLTLLRNQQNPLL